LTDVGLESYGNSENEGKKSDSEGSFIQNEFYFGKRGIFSNDSIEYNILKSILNIFKNI
jgi:hypothetical protein